MQICDTVPPNTILQFVSNLGFGVGEGGLGIKIFTVKAAAVSEQDFLFVTRKTKVVLM
jgi:hypothetical protein